ncbi:hypothetical protein EVAR_62778_1 [Eumeta japonica]|uniref:Reverse transcriptase domain-containing protein n=1 Tax=Eumeta variegata TaxID=151549 RepID=A0A4C1Z4W7_EUMVA|nr:hypothetical protein EVAR_62778_1 [Eumeta japonica]
MVFAYIDIGISNQINIRAGVPQGASLSYLLYSAYTNDIPRRSSRYSRTIPRFNFVLSSKNLHSSASRGPLMSGVDGSAPGGFKSIQKS